MNKAYKFRLYPNKEQRELIAKTFGCCRYVYNKMLGEKIDYYKVTEKSLKVTPAKYKTESPWLGEVDSLALANEQLNLETAYKNFFRNPSAGFPRFKSRKTDKKSFTTNCVNHNIRIEGGRIRLPKLGKVRMKQHRNIPGNYVLKSCTVSQSASRKYFVSILFEYDETVNPVEVKTIVGLDFSMAELYISSEDEPANYPRYYRRSLEKLKRMQRKLSKMKRSSNNYYKQKRKIAMLHEHIANQRGDFLHKQSRQIANAYDLVGIEDLDMKAMQKALKFGKSVNDNGWGKFVTLLKYKLSEQGKHLVKIDKWFPSSKTCSACGAVKATLSFSERVYICNCGNVVDRDINAAINIKREAMRLFSLA